MTWSATNITVSFGSTLALDGVDLAPQSGSVTAVVGGDGAGKTTLLRVLAGLPLPFQGSVVTPDRHRIGYMPASGGVFGDLTVAENLDFAGGVQGITKPLATAAPLLERTGLSRFTDRLASQLSGGMRRKLAVITAMLHQPDLLILDEPTTGVDPVSRSDLWRLIAAAATDGAAVVVTSAYLDEAERASTVVVLQNGRCLVTGTPEAVRESMPGGVIDTTEPTQRRRAWRRGRVWREWLPEGSPDAVRPGLEDVLIVAALAAEEAER